MKKWEKPELIILGVEETKTDLFGSDNHRPPGCYCQQYQESIKPKDSDNFAYPGHTHGAWKGNCPCCDGKPQAS